MNFLNSAFVFDLTQRSEGVRIFMDSVVIGSLVAVFFFAGFWWILKALCISQRYVFSVLLVSTNMTIILASVVFLRVCSLSYNYVVGWNYYVVFFSELVVSNILIFVVKYKPR